MLLIGDDNGFDPGMSPDALQEAILLSSDVREATHAFLKSGLRTIPRQARSLCIFQGEQALVQMSTSSAGEPHHGLRDADLRSFFLGSEDATTCMIVVIIDRETGLAWAGHYDEPFAKAAAATAWRGAAVNSAVPHPTNNEGIMNGNPWNLLDIIGEGHQRPADLYLVGAIDEGTGGRSTSECVSKSLLTFLHNVVPRKLHLRLACFGRANTVVSSEDNPAADQLAPPARFNRPASAHLVVNIMTGEAHPACFQDRGPELPRRMAYQHYPQQSNDSPLSSSSGPPMLELLSVYNTDRDLLVLPRFNARLPERHIAGLQRLSRLDNAAFLSATSTSPECERECFIRDIRAAHQWLIEAQSVGSDGWFQQASFRWDASVCAWTETKY